MLGGRVIVLILQGGHSGPQSELQVRGRPTSSSRPEIKVHLFPLWVIPHRSGLRNKITDQSDFVLTVPSWPPLETF